MEALQSATVRVVAVIAEGVPEKDTKKLIAFARANNKVIIGPATVGGVQVGKQQTIPCVKALNVTRGSQALGATYCLHTICLPGQCTYNPRTCQPAEAWCM